jgi:hypothetical protein
MRDPAVKQSLGIKTGLDKSARLTLDTGRTRSRQDCICPASGLSVRIPRHMRNLRNGPLDLLRRISARVTGTYLARRLLSAGSRVEHCTGRNLAEIGYYSKWKSFPLRLRHCTGRNLAEIGYYLVRSGGNCNHGVS